MSSVSRASSGGGASRTSSASRSGGASKANSAASNKNKHAQTSKNKGTSPKDKASLSKEAQDKQKAHSRDKADKSKDANSANDSKSLENKLADLQKSLEDMKNQSQQQAKQGGGCGGGSCGGGGGEPKEAGQCKETKDGQEKAQDQELQALAAKVLQANGGMGQAAAAGGDQSAKAELSQKCQSLSHSGFQPQQTTRVLVTAALGSDPFGGGQQAGGQNPLSQLGGLQKPAAPLAGPGNPLSPPGFANGSLNSFGGLPQVPQMSGFRF